MDICLFQNCPLLFLILLLTSPFPSHLKNGVHVGSSSLFPVSSVRSFSTKHSFMGWGLLSPPVTPQPGGPGYPFLSSIFDLSGVGDLTSSYATVSTGVGIIWPRKSRHCVKVAYTFGGLYILNELYIVGWSGNDTSFLESWDSVPYPTLVTVEPDKSHSHPHTLFLTYLPQYYPSKCNGTCVNYLWEIVRRFYNFLVVDM
jgi:hypothetical protein